VEVAKILLYRNAKEKQGVLLREAGEPLDEFSFKFDVLVERKACLAVRGPTQVPRRLMPLSRMASRL